MNSFEVVVVKLLVAICRYLIKDQTVTPRYMMKAIAEGEKFANANSVKEKEDSGWPKPGPKL